MPKFVIERGARNRQRDPRTTASSLTELLQRAADDRSPGSVGA
jgi:hypothetical protein